MSSEAQKIIYSIGMSSNPNSYLGRGAIFHDFDGDKLFSIYKKIKDEIGISQANSFALMIGNSKNLAGTNFLNDLYNLEHNNWKYHFIEKNNADLSKNNPGRLVISFNNNSSSTSEDADDDTIFIKKSFFLKIGFPKNKGQRQRVCQEFDEDDFDR